MGAVLSKNEPKLHQQWGIGEFAAKKGLTDVYGSLLYAGYAVRWPSIPEVFHSVFVTAW